MRRLRLGGQRRRWWSARTRVQLIGRRWWRGYFQAQLTTATAATALGRDEIGVGRHELNMLGRARIYTTGAKVFVRLSCTQRNLFACLNRYVNHVDLLYLMLLLLLLLKMLLMVMIVVIAHAVCLCLVLKLHSINQLIPKIDILFC